MVGALCYSKWTHWEVENYGPHRNHGQQRRTDTTEATDNTETMDSNVAQTREEKELEFSATLTRSLAFQIQFVDLLLNLISDLPFITSTFFLHVYFPGSFVTHAVEPRS